MGTRGDTTSHLAGSSPHHLLVFAMGRISRALRTSQKGEAMSRSVPIRCIVKAVEYREVAQNMAGTCNHCTVTKAIYSYMTRRIFLSQKNCWRRNKKKSKTTARKEKI